MRIPSIAQLLSNPDSFLTHIDADRCTLQFSETTRAILSSSPFIDSRTPLSLTGRQHTIPLQSALDWLENSVPQTVPDRLIAHSSFCGSTLLARMLDIEGRSFAYKEPQVLIDLARLKALRHALYLDKACWRQLVLLCLGQFRQAWSPLEASLIKPSNWANTILTDILEYSPEIRLVLMTIDPKNFLIAILRGGHDRIAYTLNVLNHFLERDVESADLAKRIEQSNDTSLLKVLKLSSLVLRVQEDLFIKIIDQKANMDVISLTRTVLIEQPVRSLMAVSETLELGLTRQECETSWHQHAIRYSKDTEVKYDRQIAKMDDQQIATRHSKDIGAALEWTHNNFTRS